MEYYTWILTFHVVAVMSWMAMLFYLPRLFVYHVENIEKKEFVGFYLQNLEPIKKTIKEEKRLIEN